MRTQVPGRPSNSSFDAQRQGLVLGNGTGHFPVVTRQKFLSKFLSISSRLSVSYSTREPALHPLVAIDGPAESRFREELNAMEEPLNIGELPCELMVNGLPFRSVQIRYVPDSADNFQLAVTDPILGAFALHSEFELVMRDEGSSWRPVTLEQLTKALTESCEFVRAGDMQQFSEIAERRMFEKRDDIDSRHRRSRRRSELTRHHECVREVQKVLREARVPHQVAGTVLVVCP